jgi:hypothetical protein
VPEFVIVLVIAALVGLAAWLGMRLSSANAENVTLRGQVASLKRQLVVKRRA